MKLIYAILLIFSFFSSHLFADELDEYAELIESSKSHIVTDFKDPYSAVFENIFIGRAKNGTPVVCGTVNAKNSYGAYTGRKRFYYMQSKKVYSELEDASGTFGVLYEAFCMN